MLGPHIFPRPRFTAAYQALLDRLAEARSQNRRDSTQRVMVTIIDMQTQAQHCQIYADQLRLGEGPNIPNFVYLN